MQKLATALLTFREKIESIKKDADNPFFKSKYADLPSILEWIKKPMKESGLALTHWLKNTENGFICVSTLIETTSGESMTSEFPIFGQKPQEVGSSTTYARRYNTLALLDIPTDEDDDGNTANTAGRTKAELPNGQKTTKWLNPSDFDRCIKEGFDYEDAIRWWIKDNWFTVGKPMQEVIRHYLANWEIIKPIFDK